MDQQHKEFLLSQYVDGTLDAPDRKLVEEQLLADPMAAAVMKDHRDVQELLGDWGNRIPLINWHEFNTQLAARLEAETTPVQQAPGVRRWFRYSAAAAALVIAASLGYGWSQMSRSHGHQGAAEMVASPTVVDHVTIVDQPATTQGGALSDVKIADSMQRPTTITARVDLNPTQQAQPDNRTAMDTRSGSVFSDLEKTHQQTLP